MIIATHDGPFHADEALAVAMLRLLPQYGSAEVVRTRDPGTLAKADIVVDVGGVYDPKIHRYDHHQRSFEETYSSESTVKLSSAGLVYRHFGREIVGCDEVVDEIYYDFVHAIDGIDNGVSIIKEQAAYRETTTLSQRVARLLPSWNESWDDATLMFRFGRAVARCSIEFTERVDYYRKVWLPGRARVEDEFKKAEATGTMILEQDLPWQTHLSNLEAKYDRKIYHVIYPSNSSTWTVRAVQDPGFVTRRPFPENWRGLSGEALIAQCGIPSAIFVHAAGFIASCKSFAGTLRMVELANQS